MDFAAAVLIIVSIGENGGLDLPPKESGTRLRWMPTHPNATVKSHATCRLPTFQLMSVQLTLQHSSFVLVRPRNWVVLVYRLGPWTDLGVPHVAVACPR